MSTAIGRYVISFFAALIVVFGLFWVMQYLIASADRTLDKSDTAHLVDFVRVERDETIERKKPKPEKPPEPEQPPPEPPPPAMDNIDPSAESMGVRDVPVDTNVDMDNSGFGLSPSDGEYLPIVKVQPVYPRRALSRGIEGYVIVEFAVTKQGTTKNVRVVEADPQGIFDRAAIQAAEKFKYKPRVIDGQPIEVPGVQNKITFEIEE